MSINLSKRETVTTDKLHIGDTVYTHGTVFKLTSCREWPADPRPGSCAGPVFSFKTEVLDDTETMIPKHWLANGWTIQGNHLAEWCRIL